MLHRIYEKEPFQRFGNCMCQNIHAAIQAAPAHRANFFGSWPILTLLGNPLSRMVQPLEGRNACGCKLIPIKPGDNANEIDSRSNAEMMQMGFGQADVARTPCEMVASMPERTAYCLVNPFCVCRSRAACNASYCFCGRTEIKRRGTLD